MALFPISEPQRGFGRGLEGIEKIIQNRQQAAMNQQQQKLLADQLAQQWKVHQDDYGLRQSQEQRAQQLQGAQLQDLIAKAYMNQAKASLYSGQPMGAYMDGGQGVQQRSPQMGSEVMQMPEQVPQGQTTSNFDQATMPYEQMGEVTVLSEGNPQMAQVDRMASVGLAPAPQTHYDDNGNLITRYPSGKVTLTKVGKTAQEKEIAKGFGKVQAKAYEDAISDYQTFNDLNETLKRMQSTLENHPNPEEVLGPVNQWATKFFGNPEDQALFGQIASGTGDIMLGAARNIKGAFTGRDQSLINSIKLNPSDQYYLGMGKLQYMGEVADISKRRVEKYLENIQNGMAPHKALQYAQEETNLEPVTNRYKETFKIAKAKDDINHGKKPTFASKEEADSVLNRLNEKQKLKLYRMINK